MKKTSFALIVASILSAAPLMKAADALPPNRIATNLAGATTAVAPPQGFNPLNASDEELALYGFPPRPDANTSPKGFETWKRAMLHSKNRVAPVLELTNIKHGPVQKANNAKPDALDAMARNTLTNSTATSSYNWSGMVAMSGATSYNNTSTFYFIYDEYIVPAAIQAYGACTGSWDYSSSWIGIDGFDSGDVLQAGTESDAYCSGSTKASYYSAWYEWYPYGEVRISSLPVTAGDDLFVEVWHTSATQGYAYIVNYQTDQYVDIGFTAPPGTSLVGNSAEWVVERPGVNGGLATLSNYIMDFFTETYALTENDTLYDAGNATYAVTMLDNNGHPISYPIVLNADSILFYDEGSAY